MESFASYLTLAPNWKRKIRLSHIWRTNILTSRSGVEQRSALYTCSRKKIRYTIDMMSAGESNWVARKLFGHIKDLVGVPLWPDRTEVATLAVGGQKDVEVTETLYRHFEEDQALILIAPTDHTYYEVGEIDTINHTTKTITLKSNLVLSWSTGTDVYPLMACRIRDAQEMESKTATYGSVKLEAAEVLEDVYCTSAQSGQDRAWPENFSPNWSKSLKRSFLQPTELLRYLGVSSAYSAYNEAKLGTLARFSFFSKPEIRQMLDFFDQAMGRWGGFFVPTWRQDIVVTSAFNASATSLTIEDIEFASYWLGTGAARYLFFDWPDGTFISKQVVGAPSDTVIDLLGPIGKGCSADELPHLKVGFFVYSRFDQDEIELTYETDSVATCKLKFTSIPEEVGYTTTTTVPVTTTT